MLNNDIILANVQKEVKNTSIKEKRKEAGMRQYELAEKMNVSPAAVNHWEVGLNKPTLKNVVKLSEVFNCKIDDLIKED